MKIVMVSLCPFNIINMLFSYLTIIHSSNTGPLQTILFSNMSVKQGNGIILQRLVTVCYVSSKDQEDFE